METPTPQFIDAKAKVAAAKAALDRAQAQREEAAENVRAARAKVMQAESRISVEAQSLAAAQADLAEALLAGKHPDKLQGRVNSIKLNVDSLRAHQSQLSAAADAIEVDLGRTWGPVADAEAKLAEAEFHELLARYAKMIAPAIPLAVEIRLRSHRTNMSMELSGLLLDTRRAQLGPFCLDTDGNLFLSPR